MTGVEMHRREGESAAQWLQRLLRIDPGETPSLCGELDLLLGWAERAAGKEATRDANPALSSRPPKGPRTVRSGGRTVRGRSALDRAKDAVRSLSPDDLSQLRQWLATL
jgi:hypothetical protein